MQHSLYQEFYKMTHRKVTYMAPITIVFVMALFKIAMGSEEAQLLAMTNYNATLPILLVLVIVGSSVFSMEYQNNAILTVLYKNPSKFNIYLAKFIVVFLYSVLLHLLAIIVTFLFQFTPLAVHVNWLIPYQYGDPLVMNMLKLNLIDIVMSLLVVSFIFVTSCLINRNSVVITTNIVIIFMGQTASTSLLRNHVSFSHILKWNPLNMLALTEQYYNFDVYHDNTLLSNPQIILGTMIYIIIFVLLGYLIFRKKRF